MRYIYSLLVVFFLLLASRFFMFSGDLKSEDNLHQEQFNLKYGIFAILKPEGLDFSGEDVPIHSSDIWERIDKELLKNTYWQSNTMLYFKKAYKYFPIIEPILQKYNIPDDFKYLAVIESGLDNVVSPSGAAGFWQIMKGTALEYGLEVNSKIDERYNLEKSTIAACQYLQDSYDKFGSWTMAAAAYNMGNNGLSRVIAEQGSNNYYNLYLNTETSRYVFRIIAIKDIMQHPKKYGFMFRKRDLYTMSRYKIVKVDSTISSLSEFARYYGVNYKLLKQFNPWLRSTSMPNFRKKYTFKIPLDTSLIVFDNIRVQNESDLLD